MKNLTTLSDIYMTKKAKFGLFILIIFVGLTSYLIYDILNFKNRMYGISEIEKEISNRYVIGTKGKDRKICDKFIKYGCLEGNIISYKILDNNIYIYYSPYKGFSSINGFLNGDKSYSVFGPYDNYIISNIDEIPNLIKINTFNYGVKEFYYSSDIETLNKEDKEIFNELLTSKK